MPRGSALWNTLLQGTLATGEWQGNLDSLRRAKARETHQRYMQAWEAVAESVGLLWASSATSVRNRGELCCRRGQFPRRFQPISVLNPSSTIPGHNKISLAIPRTFSPVTIWCAVWLSGLCGKPHGRHVWRLRARRLPIRGSKDAWCHRPPPIINGSHPTIIQCDTVVLFRCYI